MTNRRSFTFDTPISIAKGDIIQITTTFPENLPGISKVVVFSDNGITVEHSIEDDTDMTNQERGT